MVERRKHTVEVGQVFGNLTVIETELHLPTVRTDRKSRVGERAVRVRCQCGNERLVKLANLVSPKSSIRSCRSCGVHFRGTAATESVYYNLWNNLRRPRQLRGIMLASEWEDDFESFKNELIEEIGPRPLGTTLGRINQDGDYESGNLCWVPLKHSKEN